MGINGGGTKLRLLKTGKFKGRCIAKEVPVGDEI